MNRQKIYDAFIADRRLKEKALLASGDFYDRHHILPRSLGGGNEPENLICLTLIDHIRAHILLGRVHGGSQWIAVKRIFGGHKKRGHHYSRRELERIAIGRKEARKAIQGEGNPMFGRTGEKHPMFGKGHLMPRLTGEKNPMFGRTGEKAPMFGRTGEKAPMFGRGHLIAGEKHPMFGRTGEKHPMFGKGHLMPRLTGEKNPMFGRTGEKAPMFGKGYLIAGEKNPMFGKGYLIAGEKHGMYGREHSDGAKRLIKVMAIFQQAVIRLYADLSGFTGNRSTIKKATAIEWLQVHASEALAALQRRHAVERVLLEDELAAAA